MPPPFNDPSLQTVQISDFTPGIMRWQRGLYPTSYPLAPPGSAANSYRCIAKQGIGLIPLPTYTLAQSTSATDPSSPVCLTLGNMLLLSARGASHGALVSALLTQVGAPTATAATFVIARIDVGVSGTTPTNIYQNNATSFPVNCCQWPTMDYCTFRDPTTGLYARVIATIDPITVATASTGPGTWLTIRDWHTPNPPTTTPDVATGTFALVPNYAYPRVFYHAYRMGIWQVGSAVTNDNFWATDNDVMFLSDLLAPTSIASAGVFNPEMGTIAGTWGSISTGEFVIIYVEGGAVLFYGDLLSLPGGTVKLPGVMGTAGTVGRAALTPIGMIYPRFKEGVYVWNGDNRSQKLSQQVPDGVFTRQLQQNNFQQSQAILGSTVSWGEWVVFPNNWLFDTITQSWWQAEDTTVHNFQVHCGDNVALYSSPGIAYGTPGNPAILNTYLWNKDNPASSYFWLSNPIPVTVVSLVSLQTVEIVATNATPTVATITILPQVPTGQSPLQQQNGSQPLVFTIPPLTVNYRASQRLGYTDYNVQLSVTATNTPPNAAPTLHAVNIGYTVTRTSGV